MVNRTVKTFIFLLFLIPAWLLIGFVLFLMEATVWRGSCGGWVADRWETRGIDGLWFFSLPITWIFMVRRASKKSAEEHRKATEDRIGLLKVKARSKPSPDAPSLPRGTNQ
jgi:hypothetical protein